MDINSTFQDFINKEDDNNQASAMDNIIRNIFLSCDEENTGSVRTSKILDFVEPFLQENTDALEQLEACFSENDEVDMETFQKNMGKWIEKLSNANSMTNTDVQNVSPTMNLEGNISCVQYDHDFPKSFTDIATLNLSTYPADSQVLSASEKLAFENHVRELHRQKNQLNDEVARLRSELDNCQEQNESLQGNLDKLVKKLANEQKFNENLQLDRKRYDELQEEFSYANKRIVKLEKVIASLEKRDDELKQQLNLTQTEKQELEIKIQAMNKRVEEINVDKTILQSEIDLKKQELSSQHGVNVALLKQNEELQDVIEECNINIEKLRLEKENLEKLFREQAEKTETLMALNRTHNSLNSSIQSNENSEEYLSFDLKTDDSIDNQFYYNFQMVLANTSTTTNLRDEIAKATNENLKCDCETSSRIIEMEGKLLNLQRELVQHENCGIIISRQNVDIEYLSRENFSYKEQLENLKMSRNDLKVQLSLEHDKESILLEKCTKLEDALKNNTNYITEIQKKIAEYTDLENKCRIYGQKIEELETDNSMKYVKIVNLTVEIEKLRQILAKTDQQHKEELTKKINQLEQEKLLHEKEKNQLLEKIKVLNDQKIILQNEKEKLLSKIIQLENQHCELQNEKDDLRGDQEQLQAENLKYKSAKDFIELEIVRVQHENESLQTEKDLLKTKCSNLKMAKDDLEQNMNSHLGSLQKKIENTEAANKALLSEICLIKYEKKQLEIAIAEYKKEHSFNLQLTTQLDELSSFLEKLQKEHEVITTEYDNLKMETKNEKAKVAKLTRNNTKLAKDINTLQNTNNELTSKNNSLETELLVSREKADYYIKKYEELESTRASLICQNSELSSKLDKNENSLTKMDINNKQLGIDLVNVKLALKKAEDASEIHQKLNESLHSEIDKLQSSLKEFSEESEKKNQIIQELKEICETDERKVKELEMNLNSCKQGKESLKNNLVDMEQALSQIQGKMEHFVDSEFEKTSMQKHIDQLETKLQYFEEQKEIVQELRLRDEDDLRRTIVRLENQLAEEVSSKANVLQNLERVNTVTESLTETILKLESRIAFLDKQNDILDKEKINLRNLSEERHRKLMAAIKSKSGLMQRNKKLTEQNSEFSSKFNKLSAELDRKSKLLDEANLRIKGLLEDLFNAEKRFREDERQRLEILKNEADKNKEEINKIKHENSCLQHEKEIMATKIKMLEQENLESTQELENLMLEKNTWLSEKIDACNCLDNITRSKPATGFDRLVKKNMRLDDKIAVLEEQLTIYKKINEDKLREIATARERESRLSKEVADIKRELDKTITSNDILIAEMEDLINKMDKLNKENKELKMINNDQKLLLNKIENCEGLKSEYEALNLENTKREECSEERSMSFQEISELHQKLQNEIKNHNSLVAYVNMIKDRLCEKRLRLCRATTHALSVWKSVLDDNFVCSASKEGLQPDHVTSSPTGPLDEEIIQVECQFHATTSLLDKLTSIKNHETLRRNLIEPNSDLQDLIEQETSPNLNTDVLENLGLAENLVRLNNFTALEMEEKFTALVLAYTIDKKSLPRRCKVQRVRLRERERALGEEISTLSIHLEKCANGVDVSPHLEQVLRLCTQVSISAEQFGSLMQQEKVSRAVELMINYVARLRQRVDNLPNQCLSINQSPGTIYSETEIPIVNQSSEDDMEEEDLPVLPKRGRKRCTKETYFIITVSIAVLAVVTLFNIFENCYMTIQYTPIKPPV